MSAPRCTAGTPRVRARWGLAAAALLLAVSGCAGDDREPGTTSVEAPTTDTTILVLTPDAIPVLQAAALVPAGTEARAAFDDGLIEPTTVTRADFPLDGVVTIELIEGRTAIADIPAGTVLRLGLFSPGAAGDGTTPAEAGVVSE
jgi:hypothetical protein